jgi:predicted nucleic acid-binding protein
MHSAIISDSTCFVILSKIDALDLLRQLYTTVTTTPEIVSEVRFRLPDWVIVRSAVSVETIQKLCQRLDPGEASAIALALEIKGSTIILDDLKARRVAVELGIDLTGTVGVLLRAKAEEKIQAVAPFLKAIRQTNFRLSPKIESEVLREANEVLD